MPQLPRVIIGQETNIEQFNAVIDSNNNTITIANNAKLISESAINIANTANSNSINSVDVANLANSKSDNAIIISNESQVNSAFALTNSNTALTKSTDVENRANSGEFNGKNAPYVIYQYSEDKINWRTTPTENDIWTRTSTDNGITWSGAVRNVYDKINAQPSVSPTDVMVIENNKIAFKSIADFIKEDDLRLTNERKASDVYAWAKSANKPIYTASEVGALPTSTPLFNGNYNSLSNKPTIPSNTNQLVNGSGFITEANIPTSLPANGGNADTISGKYPSDLATSAQGVKADTALQPSGNAFSASALKQVDTRNTNELPPFYYSKSSQGQNFTFEFKNSTAIGLTGQSTHCQLQTYAKWADSTGGNLTQIAVVDLNMFIRTSNGSASWNTWDKLITTSSYASQTTGGTVKMNIVGTTLYITNNGNNA